MKENILNQPGKLPRSPRLEAKNLGRHNPLITIPTPRFSLSQISTFRSTWEADLRGLTNSSMTALGVWLPKLKNADLRLVAEQFREAEVTASSVSFVGGFTGSMGFSFREALDHAYESMFLAASLGAQCVVITPGGRGHYTARHERKLVTQTIRELACLGHELSLDLAVLPMRAALAKSWTFLHSLDDARSLLADVAHPRAGLALDTYQHLEHIDQISDLAKIASEIRHVQVSDAQSGFRSEYSRCMPSEGVLPLVDLVDALTTNGYKGYFDIQIWSRDTWQLPHTTIVQNCDEWARMAAIAVNDGFATTLATH